MNEMNVERIIIGDFNVETNEEGLSQIAKNLFGLHHITYLHQHNSNYQSQRKLRNRVSKGSIRHCYS